MRRTLGHQSFRLVLYLFAKYWHTVVLLVAGIGVALKTAAGRIALRL